MTSRTVFPLVSVVIPAHDVGAYIGECLGSVSAQSYPNIEVIVVDDGSTDTTPDVAREHARRYPAVRYVRAPWGGVSVARNRGIEIASGEYLCFVDADDVLPPVAVSTLVSAARKHRATAVRGSYVRFGDNLDRRIRRVERSRLPHGRVVSSDMALRELAHGRIPTMVWGWLWHRSVFTNLRFAPGRGHEDTLLVAQAMAISPRTVSIPDLVYRYRMRPGSFMQTLNPGRLDQIWAREETHLLLAGRFSSPVIRARARTGIVQGAALVMQAVLDEDPPVSVRCCWVRAIHKRVPRLTVVRACLHPLTSPGVRMSALFLLTGPRGFSLLRKLFEPVLAWRRRRRRTPGV